MSHISLRIDTDLDERLDRYSERHHLENRSQAIRHALRAMLNLEEGDTVALKPAVRPTPGAGPGKAGRWVDRPAKPVSKKAARGVIPPFVDAVDAVDDNRADSRDPVQDKTAGEEIIHKHSKRSPWTGG